jgi:hypothetical protein
VLIKQPTPRSSDGMILLVNTKRNRAYYCSLLDAIRYLEAIRINVVPEYGNEWPNVDIL